MEWYWYIIIGLGVTTLVELYILINLNRKYGKFEQILEGYLTYIDKISQVIEVSEKRITDLDDKEMFSSDDEIGFFFKTVKEIQSHLSNFTIKKLT